MVTGEPIDMLRRALTLVLVVGAPALATGLVVALVVSLLQAVTQVQDQTLSFIPKIVAMLVALILLGPWMLARLVEFGREMFGAWP